MEDGQDTVERIATKLTQRLDQWRTLQGQHSSEIGLITHLDGRIAEIAQVLADLGVIVMTDETDADHH